MPTRVRRRDHRDTPDRIWSPWHGLLHPAWWAALILLAANDHLLKGAGVLPGWLTGKLSDFTGLFVAPVLLAVIVRARSRRGVVFSYAVVGLIFALVNMSDTAALTWSGLMGAVGLRWRTVVDPSDLVALTMLPASLATLGPMMQRALRVRSELARVAAGLGVLASGYFCAATSEPNTYQTNTLKVENRTGTTVRVELLPLTGTLKLDCQAIKKAPGGEFRVKMFLPGSTERLEPGGSTEVDWNQTRHGAGVQACDARLVRVDDRVMGVAFVTEAVRATYADNADRGSRSIAAPTGEGATPVTLTLVASVRGEILVHSDMPGVFHPLTPTPPLQDAACAMPERAAPLSWTWPSESTEFVAEQVERVRSGDCWDVALRTESNQDRAIRACLPHIEWPFANGARLELATTMDEEPDSETFRGQIKIKQNGRFEQGVLRPGEGIELFAIRGPIAMTGSYASRPFFRLEASATAQCGTAAALHSECTSSWRPRALSVVVGANGDPSARAYAIPTGSPFETELGWGTLRGFVERSGRVSVVEYGCGWTKDTLGDHVAGTFIVHAEGDAPPLGDGGADASPDGSLDAGTD